MKRIPRLLVGASLVAGVLGGVATSARAQPREVDPRWAPWVGCWRLLAEDSRQPAFDAIDEMGTNRGRPAARRDPIVVCISPGDRPEAVVQTTVVNDKQVLQVPVLADATDRPITEAKCSGKQRAEWSTSGRMLFSYAQLACEGQAPRRISGFAALLAGPTWLDIQMIDLSGRRSVRVRRYEHAADHAAAGGLLPEPVGGWALASSFTIEDVKDASGKIAPAVLEAALVETGSPFPLTSRRLIELSDAGVSEEVIDLMVALTFPKHFDVYNPGGGGWGPAGGFYSPWGWDDAFAMLSLYAPFSYRYWGYDDPIYNPGWGWVGVDPGPPAPPTPQVEARVVDGRGYTRVHPRSAEPSSGSAYGGFGGSSSASGASGGSSGSSGSASPSGYSGSGGDTGRTAQPRPPGGER